MVEVKRSWVRVLGLGCVLGAGLALSVGVGCSKAPEEAAPEKPKVHAESDEVIHFNDESITYGEIASIWAATGGGTAAFPSLEEAKQGEFVKRVAKSRLLAKEAEARGMEESERFRQSFLPVAYRKLNRLFVQHEITEKVNPSAEELMQYLPPALPQVKVQMIVKEDRDAAQSIYERAMAGEGFDKLARAESEGLSRAKGGLSPWLDIDSKGMFPIPTVQRFLDADVGTILKPFYQDIGFMVVKVTAKRSAEEVKRLGLIEQGNDLLLRLRREEYGRRRDALLAKAEVNVHEDVLKRVEAGDVEPGQVLVEVGGKTFRVEDVLQDLLMGQHGVGAMRQRVRSFVEQAVIGEEAIRLGLDQDRSYRDDLWLARNEALAAALVDAETGAAAEQEVTDDDVRAYYDTHPKEFAMPEERVLRVIQLASPDDADRALARLGAGEAFAAVAREMSRHRESAANGGLVGSFSADKLPEPVRSAAFALDKGAYTHEAVTGKTPTGPAWLIVKVDDVREAAPAPFESVKRPNVVGRVQTLRRTKALSDLMHSLKDRFGYEICWERPCQERSTDGKH